MKAILIALFISSSLALIGQHTISGVVQEPNNEGLTGATVVLLDQDSVMISFALSDEEGRFKLEDIPGGSHILQATYISFSNFSKSIDITKSLDVGVIGLQPSSEILQEVTIKAEHIPMGLHGDTISYSAAAFKTKPNATVEDLLKKLPGIEVDRQGNIKAQGEDVENVLVDGKEFFGSDPKMATQNLTAEAIEKVDIYDKKSEIAEFTGVDDGAEEKTIDLKLKEDHKKGGFGTASLAGGTESSYKGKLNYFRFTTALQASVIGAANNINEQTFTINDRIDFMGGMMEAMSSGVNFSNQGQLQDGVNRSLSTGANFNYDVNSKLTIRSHYVLNSLGNNVVREQAITSFAQDFDYSSHSDSRSELFDNGHQINSKLNYEHNPFTEFVIKNNVGWDNESNGRSIRSEYFRSGLADGFSTSSLSGSEYGWNYDGNILFKRKFKKKGRSIIAQATYQQSITRSVDLVDQLNQVAGISQSLDQEQKYENPKRQISGSLNITEPLNKKFFINTEYGYGRTDEQPARSFDEALIQFQNKYVYNVGGLSIRRNTKKLKMSAGLRSQWTQLSSLNEIEKRFFNVLPNFNFNFDVAKGQSLNLSLYSSVQAPTIRQLAPITDNTYANYIYIGNPNLQPSVSRQLSVSYNYFDNFNFTSFWARLSVDGTKNRIVNRTNIDENLLRTTSPINTDNYLSLSTYLSFSRPLKPLKINYKLRANLRYAQYESFLNEDISGIKENSMNYRLSIDNRKTKYVSIESGISWDVSVRKYDINEDFNQVFYNTDFFADVEFYLPKAWVMGSELSYNFFSDEQFSESQNYTLWSANISKFFLENKLEVRLSAFDLLNQNVGFRRYGTDNSLVEDRYNNLSRYFMLGLVYKIGKGKRKGISVEFD